MTALSIHPTPEARVARKAKLHITDLMFRDTITARMLRLLCERGAMEQAEFMREYERRCARPDKICSTCKGIGSNTISMPAYGGVLSSHIVECEDCKGRGKRNAGKSSFVDNFGRFVHRISWGARDRKSSYDRGNKPYAVIQQSPSIQPPRHSGRNTLSWMASVPVGKAPPIERLLWPMDNKKLHDAFTAMERLMLDPKKIDDADEVARWVERLRNEITRRAS